MRRLQFDLTVVEIHFFTSSVLLLKTIPSLRMMKFTLVLVAIGICIKITSY